MKSGKIRLLGILVSLVLLASLLAGGTSLAADDIYVDLGAVGVNGSIFLIGSYTVPSGTVTEDGFVIDSQTALGALVAYCQENAIAVTVQEDASELYVYRVGSDPVDEGYWHYYINEEPGTVSGAQYTLTGGETVRWASQSVGLYKLDFTLDANEISPGDYLTLTATYTDGDGVTTPAGNADVWVTNWGWPHPGDASPGDTNSSGVLTFHWNYEGEFYVYLNWGDMPMTFEEYFWDPAHCFICIDPANSSPYAVEVIDSSGTFGSYPYNDPEAVLGKPTTRFKDLDNPPDERVKLVEPAYNVDLNDEPVITTINSGEYIIVEFDHRVKNDPNNPYGIDFIVFGNALFPGNDFVSDNTDMDTYMLINPASCPAEQVTVAVSQDRINWYEFTNGPYGDGMFPSQAYEWDSANHQWTDNEMDFTRPVNPALNLADFNGLSAAQAIALYDGSGGGAGFDLDDVGLDWIRYIKVTSNGGEVDAFADVAPVIVIESFNLSLDVNQIEPGDSITVTAYCIDGSGLHIPAENAEIWVTVSGFPGPGVQVGLTDVNGECVFTWTELGEWFYVYGVWNGMETFSEQQRNPDYWFICIESSPAWDVNGDGSINVLDMSLVGDHFGETGTPGWIREDVNGDGSINVLDMSVIGDHFGE